jgi:hypothetical protein
MEPYLPRMRAYYRVLRNNWGALLIIASLASILYTMNVYSNYSPQVAQQDEYIKGGAGPTSLPGPYDWVKTLTLAGIAATLLLVIYYYARNWGWLREMIRLVALRASAVEAIRGV